MPSTPPSGRAHFNSVSIDEHITFEGTVDFFRQEGRIKCNVNGEFLNRGKHFNPPLTYSMSSVGVTTENPAAILRPIYYDLLSRERYA